MLDVFVSHAWRFHPELVEVNEIIEHHFSDKVRNFSLPWHDPAITPSSEYGKGYLERQLDSQIQPVSLVLMLETLFATQSNTKWLNLELEISRKYSKEVVYVVNKGTELSASPDKNFEITSVDELLEFFTLRVN